MQRKGSNVGIVERVVRVLGGGLVAALGTYFLLAGSSLLFSAVEVAAIALGLDFVYTGLTGFCPLYAKLGWSTNRHHLTGAL